MSDKVEIIGIKPEAVTASHALSEVLTFLSKSDSMKGSSRTAEPTSLDLGADIYMKPERLNIASAAVDANVPSSDGSASPEATSFVKALLFDDDFRNKGMLDDNTKAMLNTSIDRNKGNLPALTADLNEALKEAKSPYRLDLQYKDGGTNMFGGKVAEETARVIDTRNGQTTDSETNRHSTSK